MQLIKGLAFLGLASFGWACGGIADCKDNGAACAEMLNKNADGCATAYTYQQSEKKRKACENAVKVVGDQKIAAAIPGLKAILAKPETPHNDDKHRSEAAKALAKIGDPSTLDALLEAVDLTAGTSSDPRDKNANLTNEELAVALGKMGDKRATDKLLALAEKGKGYTIVKAIRSLGDIKDPAAVERLSKIALEHPEKFVRKNAVEALGAIGDPSATDALIRMMFIEYQGVSFYREASYALYLIGPAVADRLLETMAGKNEAVNKDFEKSGGLKESAVKAKCAFVLGDLRDPRAVDPLIEAFKTASNPASLDPVVMNIVPAPLGFLGDARAVPVLKAQASSLDASLRDPVMRALNQLGDRSVVPDMIAAMTVKHFVDACVKAGASKEDCESDATKPSLWGAQKVAADQTSNLAGAEHLEAFKKVVAEERDEKIKAYFETRLKRVEAAAECKVDAACWAKKLEDADPLIREKAAWELGRIKDPSALDALGKALSDKKSEPRWAAIMAYWAYGDNRVVDAIKKQLAAEAGSADYIKVNEDLKRLLVYLERKKA